MFTSSQPFVVFDHLRVPYQVDPDLGTGTGPGRPGLPWGRLTAAAGTRRAALSWPDFDTGRPVPDLRARRFRLGGLLLHGRLLDDDLLAAALTGATGSWARAEAVRADDGTLLGSVWRSSEGDVALPFDPGEVVTRFWSERYADAPGAGVRRRVRSAALAGYYATRPVLPRSLQIRLRRAASRIQRRRSFPRWPVEDSLHGFLQLVLEWAASVSGQQVPWIAPWPAGRTWALVLTHDVETESGVRRIPVLRTIDREAGHRASWNLVPGRYDVHDALVRDLQDDGLEVGVHGLYHDGHDLDPRELPTRLPAMRRWAERWEAVGFRSPATHRNWDVMSTLPFEYDSSSPDTDPFEPQAGGCCSWWPFFNGPVVELPITLPQDHTLFVILRARDGEAWIDKAERIRAAGGMALLITHPDYTDLGPVAEAYRQLLAHFASDPGVWRPLPAEVAAWWRRRAASHLERDGAGWRVTGPAAAEATICATAPPPRRGVPAGPTPGAPVPGPPGPVGRSRANGGRPVAVPSDGRGHAVLLGDQDVAAPLRDSGVPVTVVSPRVSVVRFSRSTSGWINRPEGNEGALVSALLQHARGATGPVVLYYEEDDDLLFVSRHRAELAEGLRFVIPDADLVEKLADKAAFQRLAEQLGLPVPPTQVLDLSPVVPEAVDTTFPVLVKPVRRERDWRSITPGKAVVVNRPDELRLLLERLAPHHPRVLLQQHLPGPETHVESYHVYVDSTGDVAAEFTGRKLRTYPRSLGHSTALVTTDAPDVARLGRALTRDLGLRGVAKLDFKRDPEGRLWLLEVNPRFNLWHHVGAAAGVNIPAVVWADLVGLPRPPVSSARPGVTWCKVDRDWLAARQDGVGVAAWLGWLARCDTRSIGDPVRWLSRTIPHPVPRGRGPTRVAVEDD
ncbi:ATP-grasp domain-containing protein [Geodermatophilus maliterrae]|uniref:ATP-grasp domain-containing protein n=1 Tax=Geodermatophilus maliterrae TaxID=3162531 RepID=A0ABV3XD90_9ACTN